MEPASTTSVIAGTDVAEALRVGRLADHDQRDVVFIRVGVLTCPVLR